jgi:hypothetical protein
MQATTKFADYPRNVTVHTVRYHGSSTSLFSCLVQLGIPGNRTLTMVRTENELHDISIQGEYHSLRQPLPVHNTFTFRTQCLPHYLYRFFPDSLLLLPLYIATTLHVPLAPSPRPACPNAVHFPSAISAAHTTVLALEYTSHQLNLIDSLTIQPFELHCIVPTQFNHLVTHIPTCLHHPASPFLPCPPSSAGPMMKTKNSTSMPGRPLQTSPLRPLLPVHPSKSLLHSKRNPPTLPLSPPPLPPTRSRG